MKLLFLLSIFIIYFQTQLLGNTLRPWKPIEHSFDQLNGKLEHIIQEDESPLKATPFIQEMYHIALKNKSKAMFGRLYYWKSWTLLKRNDNLAEKLIEKAISKIDSVEYEYDYARLRFNFGTVLINRGNYLNAFILYKKLEQYFSKTGDYLFAGKSCISIA